MSYDELTFANIDCIDSHLVKRVKLIPVYYQVYVYVRLADR